MGVIAVSLAGTAVTQTIADNTYDLSQTTGTNEAQLDEMVELYRTICFDTFPDDKAVEAEMIRRHAERMSDSMLKSYLHDDPGMGWTLKGKAALFRITIELPAYHACAVRSTARAPFADLSPYRALVDKYEASWPMVSKIPEKDGVMGPVHQTISAEGTRRADGTVEMLVVAYGRVEDPSLREKNPGTEIRFVRQLVAPARGAI